MTSIFNMKDGHRLPSIDAYAHMLLSMKCKSDNPEINNIGLVTAQSDDFYFLVESRKGYCQAVPGGEFSPRLYRGQTKLHQPCKPGLFRINKYEDILFWSLKAHELLFFLQYHPAHAELMTPGYLVSGYKYDFNPYATAQHYGYPTSFLDLTRSYDVALFFATHHVKNDGSEIIPAVGETAVIYTIDLKLLIAQGECSLLPITLDPLPRPAAQKAFSLPMNIQDDFNQMGYTQSVTFDVTEKLCCDVVEMLGGLENIFPYDPFQESIIELRENNTIPISVVEFAYKANQLPVGMDIQETITVLKKGGYSVTQNEVIPPRDNILSASRTEWVKRRGSVYSKLRYRPVGDHVQYNPSL